ncbi:MAG: glucoamylase family protein [Parvibaculum sp.]|uniref:GH36-type glycosyl hydrolase domain-containing protein n=1 Tax=Parvibaculum sp. TaxID=2024848 RepID=UPI002726A8A4|nr:glucoamylase family protein [Parvibaculum sp.]MDO8840486.1 glucoamylase family protein [Parvibaculum sp.]
MEVQHRPLEMAASELRQRHVTSGRTPAPLAVWAQAGSLVAWLAEVRRLCADPPPDSTKAAEWLLDNDYQVRRAIVQVQKDLPSQFYNRLPSLTNTGDEGYPRVFVLAHGFLKASHLQLSLAALQQFVNAYQERDALTTAELWAFPTMLRLACLEVLIVSFGRLLPGLEAPVDPSRYANDCGEFEDTECVSRALANLAVIASLPWKEFFEQTSLVEAALAGDPAGVYTHMDFETRDTYRRTVEDLAFGSRRPEAEVTEHVLTCARGEVRRQPHNHVGYWLTGEGRPETERAIGYRRGPIDAGRNWLRRNAGRAYATALVLAGIAALVLPAFYLWAVDAGLADWLLGVMFALLPASVLSVTLVHWAVTSLVAPRVLPKMDFAKAIPPACATAVVVPVLVANPAEVARLIEQLEMHRLANPDPSLRFALLSDHVDAAEEHLPGDADVEEALIAGIRRLNDLYGNGKSGPFHVLHRPRRYNSRQGCWMGWERKRGKLEEFNRYVLGEGESGFSIEEGDCAALRRVRFVVTVDADTTLPPGSVARLVGALSHPLNRADFDAGTGRVRAGYTVIQPRVEISPERGNRSLFARLFTGDTSIDIYSRAVSDVYQDLFGAGIYVGKGIYEVEPFHRSLEMRVPENALVSHDLFEGAHGRVALATDIVLYEGFPADYVEYMRRWHRWVRGDWQLLPWLARQVPGVDGQRFANSLSALDRWKIFDNLRRSLVPVSLLALATAGWLVLPGSPWVWTVFTVAVPGAYLFADLVTGLAGGRRRGAVRSAMRRLADHAGRWFLALAFLVSDAATALDAIVRTLWRLAVSRRGLLEWTSAAHVAEHLAANGTRAKTWLHMASTPVFAVMLLILLATASPSALPAAAPLLLLWLVAPEIAIWIRRPRRMPVERIDEAERIFLRRVARRTWFYFETFVGPEDNWLPPDNYQEEPHAEIAHRTSPTNIGMMLLSTLTAADLGYIGPIDFSTRIQNALDTLDRLERCHGHIFNWYDTRFLTPLEPRYVSTVDSGNLAVCLLALKQGCLEAARGSAFPVALWDGLGDTLDLLSEAGKKFKNSDGGKLCSKIESLTLQIAHARENPQDWRTALMNISGHTWREIEEVVDDLVAAPKAPSVEALREMNIWLERGRHHLVGMQRDIDAFTPWLTLIAAPPAGCEEFASRIEESLPPSMSLAGTDDARAKIAEIVATATLHEESEAVSQWFSELTVAFARGAQAQHELRESLLDAAMRSERLAEEMDFRPLFDQELRLFFIGYNHSADRVDAHHYDLMATEARLASFFAIAKGDVPLEHWFFLGRPLTQTKHGMSLVSWNGSMFEYLMPPLLLRSDPGTLLGQSERAAVEIQRQYGETYGIPWGVSESAYASRDADHRYQYRAFGVPGLGLRRGLANDHVVAPYATVLALAVNTGAAIANLRELVRLGLVGAFGLFEAADFTPERVPAGQRFLPVRAYMAHHQGMILSALGNALCEDIHIRRFREDRRMRVMELLLHERIPRELPAEPGREEELPRPSSRRSAAPVLDVWQPAVMPVVPQIHMLSNGRLASWISEAGGGRLLWHGQALTRWLPDASDREGLWVYVRDVDSGDIWSVGRQPTGVRPEEAQTVFHPHMVEFHRRDQGIGLRMEVGVAAGDDVEIRRLAIVNESDEVRTLEFTSYGEVVMAPPLEDERHPAFSKLFVGSEHIPHLNGLLFTRRTRHPREKPPVMLHRIISSDADPNLIGFETDRAAFLGRNGTSRRPRGIVDGLSGSVGWTLDPAMALQACVELQPGERREVAFLTFVAGSRESVLELAERYATLASLDWALADAAAGVAHETQRLALESPRLPELQQLASLLLYPYHELRGRPAVVAANRHGQPRLWGLGISGDLPILLLRAADDETTDLLRLLAAAHCLWYRRGFHVDLVVLRTGPSGYIDQSRERLSAMLREFARGHVTTGHHQDVHLLFADHMAEEDIRLLESVAHVILDESEGSLESQLTKAVRPRPVVPFFGGSGDMVPTEEIPPVARPADLLFDNGIGGFTPDGREYVIQPETGEGTPAPWSNVLANDAFGTLVTDSGGGFTWAVNSGENRLTPWANDPVCDPPGEVFYLRDEESAGVWSPTPMPAGEGADCQIRHGAGYTLWRQNSHGLEQELLVFVPTDDPVKIMRLRLSNPAARARRVTATYYAEWVLGALRSTARPHVVCEYDSGSHSLLARNPWNPDFGERVAFLTSSHPPHSLTTDRRDFLGREGDLANPAALRQWDLGDRVGSGADPCAAYQAHLDIAGGETVEVIFILGQGDNRAHAEQLARRWQEPASIDRALAALTEQWDRRLGAVTVQTPDPAFDLMINCWLQYQTLSSRILARAGFYQAGGAFGFRDQLQDVLALLHADPARARAHVLACAARQFEEGDVLHWWHPPHDRGVRTRCSDDLLWLPYAVSHYVEATGDHSILTEEVPFLRAPVLTPEEHDRYARFDTPGETRTIFEHCRRALDRGVTQGAHGLPLIGSGDWNDGMDRVGSQGRGESVWLAWFAIAAINGFVRLAGHMDRDDLVSYWDDRAREMARAVEDEGWDGNWYMRALDDNGRPWGSDSNDECRIDSIAQSWAVLSGAAAPDRIDKALNSAERDLVSEEDQLVRLLWPPFDTTPRDPGYIKAYPPGVRENGGQYSHAAAWLGLAFAARGEGDRAWRIFEILNPINRTRNALDLQRYRDEPYVLAADVGGVAPHVGRGGWSWYTGAAAWTWRLGVEAILGLKLSDGRLVIDPCLPRHWASFEAEIRRDNGTLAIRVENPDRLQTGAIEMTVDGATCEGQTVAFPEEGVRRVAIRLRAVGKDAS